MFGVSLGLDTTREMQAGAVNRLVLFPRPGDSPFDALYAWGEPSAHTGYLVAQRNDYGLPVAPVTLPASTSSDDALTTGRADLYFFDTAVMREGTYDSEYNAYYLLLSYLPLRDAALEGTTTRDETGAPVGFDGTLKGAFRKADVEHAMWLALAHCGLSMRDRLSPQCA